MPGAAVAIAMDVPQQSVGGHAATFGGDGELIRRNGMVAMLVGRLACFKCGARRLRRTGRKCREQQDRHPK